MTTKTPPPGPRMRRAQPALTPRDIARHIERMTLELYHLAQAGDLHLLAHFLSMAHVEAGDRGRSRDG